MARAQGVRDVVARIAHTIDFRRWSDLRALYADQVSTDYTSLFGGEVQQQRVDDLIEGWRRLLAPLDATHLLGPIAMQLQGGSAIAECHVRGYHVLHGAAGGDELMVAGQWLIELSNVCLKCHNNAVFAPTAGASPILEIGEALGVVFYGYRGEADG